MSQRGTESRKNRPPENVNGTRRSVSTRPSLQSVVNLLVRQGILSYDELEAEEQRMRMGDQRSSLRRSTGPARSGEVRDKAGERTDSRMKRRLKKTMSRARWSRTIARLLFGWEWKKVKVNRKRPGGPGLQEQL